MIYKEQIEKLALESIETFDHKEDIFIVDIHVNSGNIIQVFVDSDKSIDISDCIKISRHIESNLDREKEDFGLNVSSYGLDQTIKMIRQYKKHIGRDIRFVLKNNEDFKATLISIDGETLNVLIKPKKKKELGIEKTFNIDEIQKAKIIITF